MRSGTITLDYSNALEDIDGEEIINFQEKISIYHKRLHSEKSKDKDYLGWVDLPNNFNKEELDKIKIMSKRIRNQSNIFIIIGIGGSYLGARAAIEMLNHSFYNELNKDERKGPKIYFAGHNISSTYLMDLIEIIKDEDFSMNIISKSGTTMEPGLTFRVLKEYMENKYNKEEVRKRIYITTDKTKGHFRELVKKEKYESFITPNNIGGRYSVLTPVGMLPMAVAGIDIEQVILGAMAAVEDLSSENIEENPSYQYAIIRNILYNKGKTIECLINYEPSLFYFGEWLKQLFGESEGKDGKGIFPVSMNFTTDLHSMGQYIQDGRRNIFETTLNIEKSREEIIIKENYNNFDEFNYLENKTLDFVNKRAMVGTIAAHRKGHVPNLIINIPEISPYYFGYLAYFFEKSCSMSAYLLGVNPFNQPGVEEYKRNMLKLLGEK